MKDEEVKALAIAANDLLCLNDAEEIVIDLLNTSLSIGTLRNVLLQVEMALWPFDELLETADEETKPIPLNAVN